MTSQTRPDFSFSQQITASETSVRGVLGDLRTWLSGKGVDQNACGTVEIVLAEALNNVVEHAYCDVETGVLAIDVVQEGTNLSFALRDNGHAMPGLQLPEGNLPASDGPLDDLPEGGFGWFLIHHLTQQLTYARVGQKNCLCFDMDTNQIEE